MKEWYKDWFSSELYLSVYNHRNEDDAEKLCSLILSSTKLKQGAKILDAACGAGRHSIRFCELGFNVTCFDLSKTLLNIAFNSAKEKKLDLKIFCSDIRNVPIKSNYDLIVNLFTSFGYFESDEENFSFMKNAFSKLNDNGYYILDFLNAVTISKNLVAESQKEVNGIKISEKREIIGNRVTKEITVLNENKTSTFIESVRLYSKDEIIDNAEKFGFSVKEIYGDYSGTSFDENLSNRMIVVFRK